LKLKQLACEPLKRLKKRCPALRSGDAVHQRKGAYSVNAEIAHTEQQLLHLREQAAWRNNHCYNRLDYRETRQESASTLVELH
jgi:hypothetical protein